MARHIALLTRGLAGGGVQCMMRHTADELLSRGFDVDLLTPRRGHLAEEKQGLRVHHLRRLPRSVGRFMALRSDPGGFHAMLRPVLLAPLAAQPLGILPALTRYLRAARPDGLIAATTYLNLDAIWAKRLADVPTRVIITERSHLSENLRSGRNGRAWRWKHVSPLLHRTYPLADAMIGVSDGVSRDLEALAALPSGSVRTVYNPVLPNGLPPLASQPPDDPWLSSDGPPVIMAASRLVKSKDYPTLIRAFARLRVTRPARLMILGEGPERRRLERLAARLGLTDHVRFLGWVDDSACYMRQAAVYVLPSMREGFGNVLVEALAVGCSIVATDCPSGPAEILEDGRHGQLVPVGDDQAMAEALARSLDERPDKNALRARAAGFTAKAAVDAYLDALGFAPQAVADQTIVAA
ncbi:MAG: glycosyltransferase [Pseudomonadota bacterium]